MSHAKLLFVHCLSPMHVGTGQGIGAVDLPITREVSTQLPYLPGSSIKGSLRDRARHALESRDEVTMFGPETANASDHAGALTFGDARLVCLPVRSIHGTFAWVTSPLLIQRLVRDVREADGVKLEADLATLQKVDLTTARITQDSCLESNKSKVYLEDLDLQANRCNATQSFARALSNLLFEDEAERGMFGRRLIIVHDDILAFLSKHAVDIRTRTSIDPNTKVVKNGQLWTEENLPAESILAGLVLENGHLTKDKNIDALGSLEKLCKGSVQFGGHATIGRGRCRVILKGGK